MRCLAILRALIKFVQDYEPSGNMRIQEDFGKQFDNISKFLKCCKPFTAGTEHAFTYIIENFTTIIGEISTSGKKLSEGDELKEIKTRLAEAIEMFATERIINTTKVICDEAAKQIKDGDTILVYGCDFIVKSVLLEAYNKEINFSVLVIGDGADDKESMQMLEILNIVGVQCTYGQFNSLPFIGRKVSKIIFGCESIMNNGYIVARAGTAAIACYAKSKMIPVVVCTESYKFSKKAVVHSLVSTELSVTEDKSNSKVSRRHKKVALKYDITPSKFLNMVVCEHG